MNEETNEYIIERDRKRYLHLQYLKEMTQLLAAHEKYIKRCLVADVDPTLEETLIEYGGRFRVYLDTFSTQYGPKL